MSVPQFNWEPAMVSLISMILTVQRRGSFTQVRIGMCHARISQKSSSSEE